jgi:hypothetical protein
MGGHEAFSVLASLKVKKPNPICDVCGDGRDVAEVDRDEMCSGLAGWIRGLCPRRKRRFALKCLAA